MPCQAGTLAFSAVVRRLADAARIITWQARRSWRPASPLASTWLPLACATTFALVPPARAEEASLYEVLGVDRNATEQEIKKAYKRAAVKFHPDKAHESERPQYEERFKRISRAYEILSDPEKRRSYDARGEAAFDGRDAAGFNGFGAGADPFDMFRSMFGQNFGFGQQRTPDVGYEVEATMEELYAGFSRNLSYERDAVCRKCKGMGGTDVRHCARCRGMGVVVEEHQLGPGYVQRMQRTCGACMGQGRQVRDVCSSCRGAGFMKEKVELNIQIPPGCPNGHRITFAQKADESPGMETGSVIIEVRERKHALFTRLNDEDLFLEQRVSLLDALCGARFRVKHVDGKSLEVGSEKVFPGEVRVLRGYGMPKKQNPRARGDLFVRFQVDFPKELPAGTNRDTLRPLLDPKAPADADASRWFPFTGPGKVTAESVTPKDQKKVEAILEKQKLEARQERRRGGSTECHTQ
ncbi:unnamed protein product [Effrenium voratum]|nr:unnamed protein product [Effrenium voratum]